MAMLPYHERPYRPCVGIMLINKENKVFAGQRIDNRAEAWQMPQGGIDPGEEVEAACFREMEEEIGTSNARIIALHTDWLDYDIPEPLSNKLWDGKYRGQTQKWVALRFEGDDSEVNIETGEPEFCSWRWVDPGQLSALAVPFKRQVYDAVLNEFAPIFLTNS